MKEVAATASEEYPIGVGDVEYVVVVDVCMVTPASPWPVDRR